MPCAVSSVTTPRSEAIVACVCLCWETFRGDQLVQHRLPWLPLPLNACGGVHGLFW